MSEKVAMPWGLKAIVLFYLVGVIAVAVAAFTNRDAVGLQVALVHGVPALAGLPAIVLTLVLGGLVVAGVSSLRPWGYWTTMAYMAFLVVFPLLALGTARISLFSNVLWPLVMVVYLFFKRRSFGIGQPAERPTSASS